MSGLEPGPPLRELDPTAPVLRFHPQRGTTGVVFMVMGFGLLAAIIRHVATTDAIMTPHWVSGKLIGVAIALLFAYLGAATWWKSIEFVLSDKLLELNEHPMLGKSTRRTVWRADIVDVYIEVDDGAARIMIELRDGKLPLTDTSVTDDPSARAAALRRFLGLPGDGPVRVLARGPT